MKARFDSVTVLATVAFGLLVAGIAFCLGYFLLGMPLARAAAIAAVLGVLQPAGSLWFIWGRFKAVGKPPRDGGMPG